MERRNPGPSRVYKMMVRAYPKAFRDEYGAEMLRTLEDLHQNEGGGLLRALILADLTLGCLREWRSEAKHLVLTVTGLHPETDGDRLRNSVPQRQMTAPDRTSDRTNSAGLICGVAAAALGIVYMTLAGAPVSFIAGNTAAMIIGLLVFWLIRATPELSGRNTDLLLVLSSIALLAIALRGTSVDGATRWVQLGPVSLQLSLVLVPVLLVSFARSPDLLGACGVSLASVALALQPDRAMAGVVLIALATLAAVRPHRVLWLPLFVAAASFGIALSRPDTLPSVPFVDQIFFTAFDISVWAGLAVIGGATLLLVPAVVGARRVPSVAQEYLTFGGVWLAIIAAAALGNYPTPVVGYGGSAVLGYLISVAVLPSTARVASRAAKPRSVRASFSVKENDEFQARRALGGIGSSSLPRPA